MWAVFRAWHHQAYSVVRWFFANVYHVAMYYGKDAQGNDWVIDSYGVASGAGVTVHKMSESGRYYLGDAPQLPARR